MFQPAQENNYHINDRRPPKPPGLGSSNCLERPFRTAFRLNNKAETVWRPASQPELTGENRQRDLLGTAIALLLRKAGISRCIDATDDWRGQGLLLPEETPPRLPLERHHGYALALHGDYTNDRRASQ